VSAVLTDRMVDLSCTRRTHMGPKRARQIAEEMRAQGDAVCPYCCPFCDAGWCVAHPPSMERVGEIAFAIRDLHGNAPAPLLVGA
jgi:hypothetical protein